MCVYMDAMSYFSPPILPSSYPSSVNPHRIPAFIQGPLKQFRVKSTSPRNKGCMACLDLKGKLYVDVSIAQEHVLSPYH